MPHANSCKDHPGNSFYGLAIGFTILAGAVAVGSVFGGVFHPADFLGGATMGLFTWSTSWVHLVAEVRRRPPPRTCRTPGCSQQEPAAG